MKLRRLAVMSIAVLMAMSMSGCDTIKLMQEKKALTKQVEGLQTKNKQLQDAMNSMQVTEVTPDTSLKEVEGTKIPQFVTVDGKIKFPNALSIPNTSDDVNNTYVLVGSRFQFCPSSNWQVKVNGAELDFSHPNKVWGKIKAIAVSDICDQGTMKNTLQGFFKGFPSTTIKYRRIYMSDELSGMGATADLTIDKKPYTVNVGFCENGDYGFMYLFAFDKSDNSVQQELVDLLLRSGCIGDDKVRLE